MAHTNGTRTLTEDAPRQLVASKTMRLWPQPWLTLTARYHQHFILVYDGLWSRGL